MVSSCLRAVLDVRLDCRAHQVRGRPSVKPLRIANRADRWVCSTREHFDRGLEGHWVVEAPGLDEGQLWRVLSAGHDWDSTDLAEPAADRPATVGFDGVELGVASEHQHSVGCDEQHLCKSRTTSCPYGVKISAWSLSAGTNVASPVSLATQFSLAPPAASNRWQASGAKRNLSVEPGPSVVVGGTLATRLLPWL